MENLDLFHSTITCADNAQWIAGVDEVGRGPLAGNVTAAAVILDPEKPIEGLRDSKKLSEKKRNALYELIIEHSKAYCIAHATPAEIDEINILQASLLAMKRAVDGLKLTPEFVYVDGNKLPKWNYPSEAIIGGDDQHASIAAASILAKVDRDREMLTLDQQFPDYGFASHKGYPTKAHMQALKTFGPCPEHRRSFKPVKQVL